MPKADPLEQLADSLMNRALACDKAGQQDLATAHIEVAMKVMLNAFGAMDPAED